MATTVVAPVSNSIGLASKYLPLLDKVYKKESCSAILDTPEYRVRWVGANAINVMKLSMLGLGNYDRDAGYVPGDTTGAWETLTINVDRGRSYQVDALDDEESLSVIVGNLLGEVERVHVIPEMDAYCFAKLAGATGIDGSTGSIVVGTTDVPALISAAEASMDDNEVPSEGRILFVSPTCYNALKAKIERRIINSENNVNTNVEYFDDMRIIRVPQARFSTAITLATPSAHNGAGDYTATGENIHFMIVHPSAVVKVLKHYSPRLFTPEQNIEADAYRLNYRYAADTFVLANKAKGIYVYAEAAATT